jgi:hypothetical protein
VETEMMPMVTDLGASFLCSCTPMDFRNVGVMEYWIFQKNRSLFNVLPVKFYNYIIIYFLIKKYIVE